MAQTKVTFYQGLQSEYDSAITKDPNGIYFLSDSKAIYKGNVKYGSDVQYATSSAAGIVKPSSDFDVTADGTISLYKAIAVNSISNNVNTQEKGKSISSVTVSWTTNKMPTTLSLSNGSSTFAPAVTAKSQTITYATPLTSNATFTLTAKDARGATSSKSTYVTFLNGKYYGVGTVTAVSGVTNAFVQGLTKQLASSRTGSFTVTAAAGQYIYFAIPASFGTPSFFVGGFEGGFDLLSTFNYTNPSGFTESYNVYKSTNAGLGATTVEVK